MRTAKLSLLLMVLITVQFCYIYSGLLLSQKIFMHDSIIWFGSFYYYIDNIINGHFSFWDPYIITGSPFYPNIHGHGLLDPLIAIPVLLVKFIGISPLTAWTYFCLLRLAVFTIGAYLLFKHITNCRLSAMLSAGILLFSVAPVAFRQMGIIENAFLTPFSLYFLLLFFDNVHNEQRYLYLGCLVGIIGIGINIAIPAFFVFNLVAFIIALLVVLKIVQLDELGKSLRDKRFLISLFFSSLLILMMALPSISLYKEGELFPSHRIIQKNNEYFKKLVATEIGDSVISDKFAKELGVYSSYGNILNPVCPDMWRSFFIRDDFFARNDFISESLMYIGIIPFLLCIIGYLYDKSRYRYLALIMLVLISANMFSFYGVHSRPPNLVQALLNTIFPLIKAVEGRGILSSFFLLYLCMLLSLGLKMFFNQEGFLVLIKEKYRQIAFICIVLLLLKMGISIYCFKGVYRSGVDLLAMVTLIFFAAFIYAYSTGRVRRTIFYSIILLLIFADVFYYDYTLERFVLRPNWLEPILSANRLGNIIEGKDAKNYFEYSRRPFVDVHDTNYEPIAFSESILKAKGAISKGNNHHFFTTRRYYDYLTHVSLENQFVLSGVSYPILRFFPMERVKFMPDKELLRYLETDNEGALSQYLFISKSTSPQNPETTEHNKFNRLDDFEDVPWLKKEYVSQYYADYLNRRAEHLTEIKENINKYLETPVYQLEVRRFSPNKLTLSVKNQQEGYLYYSDGWSRHWKAFDGKREIPVEIANYNFKAVHLQGGGHTIRFVYDPRPYRYSLIAYCVGLLASASICTAVLILTYRKERLG
ncbi:MAG TPA: hypothetical protein ACFYEA_09485 [Candidatus Tripitaka californicus]|uniref:hypothetical protein n=1 Tax=Candidatus Tripitaka californicus TaxID=3367616 RepID=UPI0040295862